MNEPMVNQQINSLVAAPVERSGVERVGVERANVEHRAAPHEHAPEHGAHDGHGHGEHGHLHHHFDDMEQQRESTLLGMWAFLCTEVMMFGGLMFCYTLYRYYFYPAFSAGSSHLDIMWGTINTFVLLFSSLTMAFAVRNAQLRNRKQMVKCLVLTMVLGTVFLGIKAKEWTHDYHIGLVPVLNWNPELAYDKGGAHGAGAHSDASHSEGTKTGASGQSSTHDTGTGGGEMATNAYEARTNPERAESKLYTSTAAGSTLLESTGGSTGKLINKDHLQMFFFLYFCMTGLHAIHMVIGMGIVGYMTWLGHKGMFTNGNDQPIELLGLYWHFVDIVWIFLFPLLYLIGGKHVI